MAAFLINKLDGSKIDNKGCYPLGTTPTLPLNPINPDNARILRITAAAGTELADPYSYGTYKKAHVPHFIPV